MCYLFIAYLNFKAKLGNYMQHILRVLQLNLFEQRALADLFRPPDKQQPVSPKLLLCVCGGGGATMRQH